jgi:hypothetical protein
MSAWENMGATSDPEELRRRLDAYSEDAIAETLAALRDDTDLNLTAPEIARVEEMVRHFAAEQIAKIVRRCAH